MSKWSANRGIAITVVNPPGRATAAHSPQRPALALGDGQPMVAVASGRARTGGVVAASEPFPLSRNVYLSGNIMHGLPEQPACVARVTDMSPEHQPLRKSIVEFLAFLDEPPSDLVTDRKALAAWLDRLAMLATSLHAGRVPQAAQSDVRDIAAPCLQERQKQASRIGRRFGADLYWLAIMPFQEGEHPPEPEIACGSLVDDIADIRQELEEVLAIWESDSAEDAVWSFDLGYTSHWGRHLRQAQHAIHTMLFG